MGFAQKEGENRRKKKEREWRKERIERKATGKDMRGKTNEIFRRKIILLKKRKKRLQKSKEERREIGYR